MHRSSSCQHLLKLFSNTQQLNNATQLNSTQLNSTQQSSTRLVCQPTHFSSHFLFLNSPSLSLSLPYLFVAFTSPSSKIPSKCRVLSAAMLEIHFRSYGGPYGGSIELDSSHLTIRALLGIPF
uniref:Uncharacterized protein n=1 Tax=Caenorhabditis japonica TaxID=281687 RepID=A0A8R1EJF0_CAEJA